MTDRSRKRDTFQQGPKRSTQQKAIGEQQIPKVPTAQKVTVTPKKTPPPKKS